jgi:GxxExxY protein
MIENDLSYKAIGAAIEIHKNVGPGLLESCYENALGV